MSGSRYRPFTLGQFQALMDEIGFCAISPKGVFEHVYQRMIHNGPGTVGRFVVRIYSTVDVSSGVSRDNGSDAIRILLHDLKLDRPVTDWTVHRTQNAFANTKQRAREAWGYAMKPEHHCSACAAMMVKRTSKKGAFLGCTAYPLCTTTKAIAQ